MTRVQFIIMGTAVIIFSAVCKTFDIELDDRIFLYVLVPSALAVGFLVAVKGGSR